MYFLGKIINKSVFRIHGEVGVNEHPGFQLVFKLFHALEEVQVLDLQSDVIVNKLNPPAFLKQHIYFLSQPPLHLDCDQIFH